MGQHHGLGFVAGGWSGSRRYFSQRAKLPALEGAVAESTLMRCFKVRTSSCTRSTPASVAGHQAVAEATGDSNQHSLTHTEVTLRMVLTGHEWRLSVSWHTQLPGRIPVKALCSHASSKMSASLPVHHARVWRHRQDQQRGIRQTASTASIASVQAALSPGSGSSMPVCASAPAGLQ